MTDNDQAAIRARAEAHVAAMTDLSRDKAWDRGYGHGFVHGYERHEAETRAAREAVEAVTVDDIARALALAYGSHVNPPRGGKDCRAADAVLTYLRAALTATPSERTPADDTDGRVEGL